MIHRTTQRVNTWWLHEICWYTLYQMRWHGWSDTTRAIMLHVVEYLGHALLLVKILLLLLLHLLIVLLLIILLLLEVVKLLLL